MDQQNRLVSSIIISITDDSARDWVRHTTSGVPKCSKYVLSNSIYNHGFAVFSPFMNKRQRWSTCKPAAIAERVSGDWLGLVNCMKFWANHVAYWRKLIAFRHLNENRSITYHYILDCLKTHVVPCSSSDICCPYKLRRIERAKKIVCQVKCDFQDQFLVGLLGSAYIVGIIILFRWSLCKKTLDAYIITGSCSRSELKYSKVGIASA